ncbi:winged helix-turn-helix domain-containing protein [Streptomyces sp. NPDC092296]|uniref:winged helix-turn-helix domain-containing protein n=1 Tax=Streptomyces sp. NPDC092296 TaxID=3366012 RepID=UPI00382F9E3C
MSIASTLPVTPATPTVPRLRAVRPDSSDGSDGSDTRSPAAEPVRPLFPDQLPEGAVLAALPQAALPAQLLEQYGGAAAQRHGAPMVGYLVLLPAGSPPPPGARQIRAADSPLADSPLAGSPLAGSSLAGNPLTDSRAEHSGDTPAADPAAAEDAVGITVDLDRRTAHVDGRPLDLTFLEFELLAHLTAHPHRVHSRDHLVSAVWGYGHVGDGRTVDVHVARLRRKLGTAHRDSIVTVRRVGYKYAPLTRG